MLNCKLSRPLYSPAVQYTHLSPSDNMLANWCFYLMFVDPRITVQFLQWKTQQDATVYQNFFIIPYFKWSSTCFGRHVAHHQEPKTAPAASGFAYVEGCRTCSCWTSGSVRYLTTSNNCRSSNVCYLTMSNNCMSGNLPRMQNQRLLVQFWAPGDGRPETCWASSKIRNNKKILIHCCILLGFSL
jgi:hypothetical protein